MYTITVQYGSRAVAVMVAEGLAPPLACASRAFEPTVLPTVQDPTVAVPVASVVAVAPVTLPPPLVTEKVTVTPDITAPCWSRTTADGARGAAELIRTVWPLPELNVIEVATGA